MGHEFPPFYQSTTMGCGSVSGVDGSAIQDASGDVNTEHSLVEDPTAPASGPAVHSIGYPAGKEGESSHEKIWAWKTPAGDPCDTINQSSEEYHEVYVREVRKIWTDRSDGTVETFGTGAGFKFSHVKGHLAGGGERGFSLTLGPAIDTDRTFQSRFKMKFRSSWTDRNGNRQSQAYGQNVSDEALIVVGQWHQVEWQVIVNTIAADGSANPNGVVRAWVDGELVIDRSDVKMRSGRNGRTEEPFQNYDLTTTWSGGPSNTHTHDKGFYVDHVYISGKKR